MNNTQTTNRLQLFEDVRNIFSIKNNDNLSYFLKSEMMQIAEFITGITCNWTSSTNYFSDHLESYGYGRQLTVDTHPTIRNLIWLAETATEINLIENNLQPDAATDQPETVDETIIQTNWLETFRSLTKVSTVDSINFSNKTLTVVFK